MHDLTGQFIKGYELRARIGVGGYGVVYRAMQPSVDREVAVKIILPQYANHPDFIRRFEAEAQLVARLEHPHIVPLYDYWRQPDSAVLVMRYVRGGSLHDQLTGEPWSPQGVAGLLDQLGAALTVAHRHGVVHRDLKPANILLDEDGNAYLADFGIAKNLGSEGDTDTPYTTQTGAVVGSPAYISPEQIKAEPITPQTDIYSLGIMLYEILTGALPFEGPTPVVVMFKHVHEQLPRLQTHRPDLPDTLNAVIQRATAKHPDQRYADVMALVADYRHAIGAAPLERSLGAGPATDKADSTRQRKTGARRTGSIYDTGVLYHTALMDAVVPAVENPYKGLRAFQEADAADFFGREALVKRLLARLAEPGDGGQGLGDRDGMAASSPTPNPHSPSPTARFLAVVGPSGSGKSSVVRAGVIPALRHGALPSSRHWFVVEMIPGVHPMAELSNALLRVAVGQPPDLLERLQKDERGLLHAVQRLLPGGAETELLLVIDQFEEIFTLVESEAERTHFLNSLLTAVTDSHTRLRVIMTLRADFYDRPLLYAGLSELVRQRTEVVTPLADDELQHAIVGPARRVGVALEPALAAAIMRDVDEQPGTLPLMEYVLTELFDHRSGRVMTLASYQQNGGVMGALARRADAIYNGFGPQEQGAARQLFLRLVTLGEGMEDTRRRVLRNELATTDRRPPTTDHRPSTIEDRGLKIEDGNESADAKLSSILDPRSSINGSVVSRRSSVVDEVIDTYGKYRLLTFDRDPVTRGPTVEVAHEALIRTWGRLRGWLDASRDDLRTQRRLASAAAEWAAAGRDRSYLASGVRLEQFAEWAWQTQLALNTDERAYLDTSMAERDALRAQEQARWARESALERRSRNVLRALVAVFVVATVLALGLASAAFTQQQEAQRNAEQAENARREAQSNAEKARQQETLAISNAEQARRSAEEARNVALFAGAQAAWYQDNPDQALTLAIAANSTASPLVRAQSILAEAAYAPGTRLLLQGHKGAVQSVVVSADGRTALSGSSDTTVILWDLTTGKPIRTMRGHQAAVQQVVFSPDGRTALSASADKTLILWDLATGKPIRTLTGHTGEVKGVSISPDGRTALSASADKTLILWDLATGKPIRTFGHPQEVNTVAFSPDGKQALSGSQDLTLILWDIATGTRIRTFEGHTKEVRSVAWSADGTMAVSCSNDKTIIVWDIATGTVKQRFSGHSRNATSVMFSPDGQTILSSSADNRLGLWDVKTGTLIRFLAGHGGPVHTAAFGPDGHTVLSGSADNTLRLWDLDNHGEIQRFMSGGAQSVALSPVGKLALSGIGDPSVVTLWDVSTGKSIHQFAGHNATVRSVAFSPDGRWALSGSLDKFMILWDVAERRFIRRFEGHTGAVNAVAFSPDGKTAISGSEDETLILWDLNTGKSIRTFKGHTGGIPSVAFSPDGRTVVSASADKTLILWDVTTGAAIRRFEGHTGRLLGVAFSPDGSRILSSSIDKTMILWDTTTGKPVYTFPAQSAAIQTVAFSPDGKTVISGADDNSVILWDLASGEAIRHFVGHTATVRAVVFSSDGKTALSGSGDETMRLWRIESREELLAWAKANRYIAPLTCEQQQDYQLSDLSCVDSDRAGQ
jgi:WD40 repeat protein